MARTDLCGGAMARGFLEGTQGSGDGGRERGRREVFTS